MKEWQQSVTDIYHENHPLHHLVLDEEEALESADSVQAIEHRIVNALLDEALRQGLSIDVSDGEETTVVASTDRAKVLAAMFTTDGDLLTFRRDGRRLGWVHLIYGNDGHDVMHDWSTSQEMDKVTQPAIDLANQIEGS